MQRYWLETKLIPFVVMQRHLVSQSNISHLDHACLPFTSPSCHSIHNWAKINIKLTITNYINQAQRMARPTQPSAKRQASISFCGWDSLVANFHTFAGRPLLCKILLASTCMFCQAWISARLQSCQTTINTNMPTSTTESPARTAERKATLAPISLRRSLYLHEGV